MHQHHLRILKIVLIYLDTMKLLVMLVALTSDIRLRIMAGLTKKCKLVSKMLYMNNANCPGAHHDNSVQGDWPSIDNPV